MADIRSFYHPEDTKLINLDRMLYADTYNKSDDPEWEEDTWVKIYFDTGEVFEIPYNDHNMWKLEPTKP